MTEETHNAATAGSIGIIMAIGVSAVLGLFLLLGLLFSIQDLDRTVNAPIGGQPVAQIFLDTVGEKGAIVLMVRTPPRLRLRVSRSGADGDAPSGDYYRRDVLLQDVFDNVQQSHDVRVLARRCDPRAQVFPQGGRENQISDQDRYALRRLGGYLVANSKTAVWLACTLSFILGLPSLGSSVAFSAATSIATIGLYISYGTRFPCRTSTLTAHLPASIIGIPIALRVLYGKRFKRGPFHLGPFSYPVAIISCLWILFIAIAFILPQENPVNSQTLNYAIVAVGIVATYALGFWLVSARKWFTGPIKQITSESYRAHWSCS